MTSEAPKDQQPLDPYKAKNKDEDVTMDQKLNDLFTFIDKNKFCMLTTRSPEGHLASRCMALAGKEDNGTTLLFHMNSHSGKTADISSHPSVNLAFLNYSGEWASISGSASYITPETASPEEREQIKKHYSVQLKAWIGDMGDGVHDGGPNDPRLGLIRIKAKTANYALNGKGPLGRAVEIAKGVATGETAGVNLLRAISETEFREWAEAET